MRHLSIAVAVLGLIWAAACSSTTNTSNTAQPTREVDRFSVSTEGSGEYTPALDVVEGDTTTTVTVRVEDAAELTEALLNLHYDADAYTPATVEFGDFLGADYQVVTLAVTNIAGQVPIGVVQTGNGGAQPRDGEGVIATVTFNNMPFAAGRSASAFPKGQANAVNDLTLEQNGDQAILNWTEKNKGDYDNNGQVSIADLSPLGKYLDVVVLSSPDPTHMRLIDGDGNGSITLADLTPLGSNLGNEITGYWIFKDEAGTDPLLFSERPETVNPKAPVEYEETVSVAGAESFTVRGAGTTQSEMGEVSNPATPAATEDGPPAAPTGLTASVNDASAGNLTIKLTWTGSSSPDVNHYVIERKLSSDPVSSFALVYTADKSLISYSDSSGPLTDNDYDYRIKAVDNEATPLPSEWSNIATGNPFVQTLDVPTNVTATPGGGPVSIIIDWDAPADPTDVLRYQVYRKGPGEITFSPIGDMTPPNGSTGPIIDSGLTEGEDYQYYVTSRNVDGSLESDPSAPAMCQPSGAVQLEVSVVTDKTTHHTGGAEPASNLAASSNIPGTTYTWSASLGSVTGSGANVTWKPSGSPTPQVVTITVTGTQGAQTDDAQVKLFLTSETIKTTYNIEAAGQIGEGGTGKFVDFSRPSVQQPNAPYKSFKTFFDEDKAVLYNMWEIWCGPCRGEMDEMHEWATDYEAYDYVHVAHSSTYTLQETADWLNTPGMSPAPPNDTRPWNKFYAYNVSADGTGESWAGDMPLWNEFWSQYGPSGMSLPRTLMFDKDGMCRRWSSTIPSSEDASWRALIKELTGAP